ncbi:MAG: hypothetical protein ACFB0D_06440 [Phormidesmis sp.]
MISLQKQRFNKSSDRPSDSQRETSSMKAKALKLSSVFLGLGLSIATVLGTASTASAVTLRDVPLPPSAGYRNASTNNIQAESVYIDGNEVKIWYLDIAAGTTEVCLELGNDVSWWKGLKVFGASNTLLSFVARTGEARSRQCDSFSTAALSNGDSIGRVDFWKAKAFGVHTHVDTLNLIPEEVNGKQIVFWWVSE